MMLDMIKLSCPDVNPVLCQSTGEVVGYCSRNCWNKFMSNVFLNFFVLFLLKFLLVLMSTISLVLQNYYCSKNFDANKPIGKGLCNTRVDSSYVIVLLLIFTLMKPQESTVLPKEKQSHYGSQI